MVVFSREFGGRCYRHAYKNVLNKTNQMYLNQNFAVRVALVSVLLVVLVFAVFVETASAQATAEHWVTVSPATSSSVLHSNAGQNCSISFRAVWTYGESSGQAVANANVTVEVKTGHGDSVENITQATNAAGYAAFHYSFSVPVILTFTPMKLVTQDGSEWNGSLLENGDRGLYGFQSESVTVYYDTFDVALVSANTETLGLTEVAVNVTYLLVPEEGLTLPQSSNSSQQQVISKIAHGVDVTINGVKAEETDVHGIYTASFSTWLPTAYVIVEVSQEEWTPTHTGFSFTHNSNVTMWTPAIILCLICTAVSLTLYFALNRKSKGTVLFGKASFPVFGGVLLAIASFISLYWGIIGFDSTMHGFDWALFGVAGLSSFGCGLAGSVMSLKKKNQTLAIFAACAPLVVNEVAVKAALDVYQLSTPWVVAVASLVIAVISGILISNSNTPSA